MVLFIFSAHSILDATDAETGCLNEGGADHRALVVAHVAAIGVPVPAVRGPPGADFAKVVEIIWPTETARKCRKAELIESGVCAISIPTGMLRGVAIAIIGMTNLTAGF